MFGWLDTRECVRFGQQLANKLLPALEAGAERHKGKFAAKAEKALIRTDGEVREFRQAHKLNFYKRSRLANSFLWALKDGGCPEGYARELTDWLSHRL